MSTLSQFGGGARIKSIQRGTITISGTATSATATISSVNTNKTELRLLGFTTSTSDPSVFSPRIALTNETTITAIKSALTSATVSINWELTEWY